MSDAHARTPARQSRSASRTLQKHITQNYAGVPPGVEHDRHHLHEDALYEAVVVVGDGYHTVSL